MSDQPEFLAMEEKIVYDFDELREENDYPVREICTRIQAIIEPLIGDEKRLKAVHFAMGEIFKDMEAWGEGQRQVTLRQELGGVAINTINNINVDSAVEHNGFGRLIVDEVFGDDYSSTTEETPEGDIYKGYLFIRADQPIRQLSEIDALIA